ncbi:MAG: hypothetical protein GY841_15450 [FCB group bacterium]|nr:hypothetical protein [FCB group bacterium]
MVLEFQNKDFSIAGPGPGQAEDWILTAFLQLPGFAKFKVFGGLSLEETFEWYDAYAILWSGVEPYDFSSKLELTIVAVGTTPDNYFEVVGDVRRLLPPSACFQVTGTVPDQTNLDAYWIVESIEMNGVNTRIYVTEEVLADVPAEIYIPPIIYFNIDNYGWGARLTSGATYPIAPFTGGEVLELQINHGATQSITFSGGETTAQNVVDLLNSQFVTLLIDSDVVAELSSGVPIIKTKAQSTGNYLQVLGGTANTSLQFPTYDHFGFGQFAQLFDIYWEDAAAVTAEELSAYFKQYVEHGDFHGRESQSGGNVMVRSEKAGDVATCQVWGYYGEIMTLATWPIAARSPANNTLNISFDGEAPVAVVMTVGATTAEEIKDDIRLAIASTDSSGVVTIADNGQLIISGPLSVQVISGTAITDLGLHTNIIYGNNHAHSTLGFTSDVATGKDEIGFFSAFDMVAAIAANFAGGTTIQSTFDSFEWTSVVDSLDRATTFEAAVKSWAEWLHRGAINSVTIGSKTFVFAGLKEDYFYVGVKCLVQGSTGNDKEYTVATVSQGGGGTTITVVEDIPDSTADGEIYPLIFPNGIEDFDQGWDCTFLSNPDDQPHWFFDGVLVGDTVDFPLNVASNRDEMWIYVGSETNLVHITIAAGIYDDAGALVSEMNARFSAASSAQLEFSVRDESTDNTSAKIAFGWSGSGTAAEEFFFVNRHGQYEGLDIRETIGMLNFVSGIILRIKVPSHWFEHVGGVPHGTTPNQWADDTELFEVDPDSRFSYTIQTTPAGETVVIPEGSDFALFNKDVAQANSAYEAFIPEAWGGELLETAAADPSTFSDTLTVAIFDTDQPTPEDVEDFEEGWP